MSGPRIASLCSGYEGLGMAVQQVLGGELAFVADNDPGAAKILAHHYPDVPNHGDITTIDWAAMEPVDILTGGYPCQPDSDAGLRKGTNDERWIWPHFIPAIRVLRPRLVVLENVRGHLGRGFSTVLGDLAALRFDAEWVTMPAAGVGACHRRQRIFVLAWPAEDANGTARGERRIAGPGEAPGGRPWADTGRSGGAPVAADALRSRRRQVPGSAPGDEGSAAGRSAVLDHEPSGTRADTAADTAGPRRGRAEDPGAGGGNAGARARGGQPERGGRAAPDWAADEFWHRPGAFGDYEAAVRQHERTFGRRAPAPVEPGRGGQPRLAPAFAEWMMGLPAGWVTAVPGLSRNGQLHAIGNGVVPAQAAAAIRSLLERAPEATQSLLAPGEITEAEIYAFLGQQSAELAQQVEEGAA